MDNLFLAAAGLGGSLILIQFLLAAAGLGGDHDTDHDTDHESEHGNLFFGLLTLRSVAAGVGFFGLGGLSARYYDLDPLPSLSAGAFAGFAALYGVATLMRFMKGLKHDGTVKLEQAVGRTAGVYLRIPGGNAGAGKVTVAVGGRSVECQAFTAGDPIPTGGTVRVVAVRGPNSLEVEAV